MSSKYDPPAGPPPAYIPPNRTGPQPDVPPGGANAEYYGSSTPEPYQQAGPVVPHPGQQYGQPVQQQPYNESHQQPYQQPYQQSHQQPYQQPYPPQAYQQNGMHYQQPMYGQQRGYYDSRTGGGTSEGILAGLCGALACCCCLDFVF